MFPPTNEYPLAWIRDEWKPTGKWGHREGQEPNYAELPYVRQAYGPTLKAISEGNVEYASLYGMALARAARRYLNSWQKWKEPKRPWKDEY